MLSVVMPNVVIQNVANKPFMLSVVMPNVVMLNVVMLNVVAPKKVVVFAATKAAESIHSFSRHNLKL
jgi:hypothetical protein